MAKLTKRRARKPLAESQLDFSAGAVGGEAGYSAFTIGIINAANDDDNREHYQLRFDRAEAERIVAYLTVTLGYKIDRGGNHT